MLRLKSGVAFAGCALVVAAGLVATPASAEPLSTTVIQQSSQHDFTEALFGSDLNTLDMPESAQQAHPTIVRLLETDVSTLDAFEAKRLYAELESSGELGLVAPVSGQLSRDGAAVAGDVSIAAVPLWILRAAGRMVALGAKIAKKYGALKRAIQAGKTKAVNFLLSHRWSLRVLIWVQKKMIKMNPSAEPIPKSAIAGALVEVIRWVIGLSAPLHVHDLKSTSNPSLRVS